MHAVDADRLTNRHLYEHLLRAEDINRRNWEIHFILMYPADAIYLEFEAFCKSHGLDENGMVALLVGFTGMPARTDEELWELAKAAKAAKLDRILLSATPTSAPSLLSEIPEGRDWLARFNAFLVTYGNRINAAHLDVIFHTWREDPTPVFETIRSYFRRIDDGWDFAAQRNHVFTRREEAVAAFGASLSGEDHKTFLRMLPVAQKIYAYQEDHGFYIDQGSTAALHDVLASCGRRLARFGLLADADDIYFLTYAELSEVLSDLARDQKIGIYHHSALLPSLIAERKAQWEGVSALDAPLT